MPLAVNRLVGFNPIITTSGGTPPVLTYVGTGPIGGGGGTGSTSRTGSINIGTAASDRRVIFIMAWNDNNASITSATINSVSATIDTNSGRQTGIISAAVPTGSGSQSCTVNFSVSVDSLVVGVWTCTGLANNTGAYHTNNAASGSTTINIPAPGFTLVGVGSSSSTNTWTNTTERFEGLLTRSTFYLTGSDYETASGETGRSVSSTGTSAQIVAASYG